MAPRWSRALVTGASSGIGEAFARRLAADGTELVLVARRGARLRALAAGLAPAAVEVVTADLGEPSDLARVEARLADADRPVDLLVNNAGFGTSGPFADLPADREELQVRVNVVAPLRLARAALPGMRERGRGAVVNVASLAAYQPYPYGATYGATKAFLASFSQALHEELRGSGVRVLALCPGFTRTEFQQSAGVGTGPVPDGLWMSADRVAAAGLRALSSGRVLTIPGVVNATAAAVSKVLPAAVTRRVVAVGARRRRAGA
ncbi:MAG: SDR family oxidoreductase [Actinobacteria bacterium]|nr:SDR family oxidoreductase [Actinomycetota bacterium]